MKCINCGHEAGSPRSTVPPVLTEFIEGRRGTLPPLPVSVVRVFKATAAAIRTMDANPITLIAFHIDTSNMRVGETIDAPRGVFHVGPEATRDGIKGIQIAAEPADVNTFAPGKR